MAVLDDARAVDGRVSASRCGKSNGARELHS
jgi:hypothetical protein